MSRRAGLLSILVPVYNERAFLRRCIEKVLAAPLPEGLSREVILVDDASTDGTADLVDELGAKHPGTLRVFHQPANRGKGAAIRRAIREMRGEYVIFQDADLEYDPGEYAAVLQPLLEGRADVVYGSRFASRRMRRVLNYHHTLGNLFLTHLSNFFTGLNLTDMETCYKAFRADILKTIPIRSDRFGLEPEITAKIAKRGCAVYEVPISYYGRSYADGKKITWQDGLQAIGTILRYWIIDDVVEERYGHEILIDLSRATRFNRWIARTIEPFLGSRILEIGSGIANVSRYLPQRERLVVSDVDAAYLELLRSAYRDNDLVDVKALDITSDADVEAFGEERFDTIVCLNVLEHVAEDEAALQRLRRLLAPGGRLVLLVPQYGWLYGTYDRALGHERRYGRRELAARLRRAGYTPVAKRSFNALAILGWWVNGRLLGRRRMGRFQIKFFDMLVPLLKPVEYLLPLPGLSLLMVGRREEGVAEHGAKETEYRPQGRDPLPTHPVQLREPK